MATWIVRADGTGDFTTCTAAFAGGVNPGDTVEISQAGTYTESWMGVSIPAANVTVRNTSGGTVVLAEAAGRATYMVTMANGLNVSGVTWSFSGASYNRWALANAVTGWAFADCAFSNTSGTSCAIIRSTGATLAGTFEDCAWNTGTLLSLSVAAAGLVTLRRCTYGSGFAAASATSQMAFDRVTAQTGGTLWSCSHAGCSVSMENCAGSSLLAAVSTASAGTVEIRGCKGTTSGNAVSVVAGRTVTSLQIYGTYAMTLVANAGTITAFAGAHNAYVSTAAGTSSATDRVVGNIADFRLGGPSGLEPQAGSALLDVIPVGVTYGTSAVDLLGFPRLEGGQQTVGPVQARLPRTRPVWRKVA